MNNENQELEVNKQKREEFEQLMKDFRYKVSSALYEAGLSNKLATQDALRNISLQTSPIINNNVIVINDLI